MTLSENKKFIEQCFSTDELFDKLYPLSIQVLARKHWTPLLIARKAASFLTSDNNARILDIGSGVGKFCLTAAYFKPDAFYYGVEQRKSLINYADTTKSTLGIENVSFIHGNFTQLDFRNYDHFYFFNSFYENLSGTNKIDDSIDYSRGLYNYYNRYLYQQLELKPAGTKLATYHSLEEEVPEGYRLIGSEKGSLLKYWIKN